MKKAIETKNIMLAVNYIQKTTSSPSHQPSPSSTFHRVDTSPTQGKFKGSKIVRRLNDCKTHRRFSYNPPKLVKSPHKNHKQQKQLITLEQTRKNDARKKSKRYDNPFVLSQQMQHSYSNMKINSMKEENDLKVGSVLKPQFEQAKTSMNWIQLMDRKNRIKSEPTTNNNFKEQIMKRVSKKIQFMKKMTLDGQIENPFVVKGQKASQTPSKLFNFDRLYDHCLKKINKGINFYQKDIAKNKDRKYYQLKIQSTILSNQLKTMRRSIMKKKDSEQSNLGVIGNFIDVSKIQKGEKVNSQRQGRQNSTCKKKLGRITKNMEGKNPFGVDQLHGWQVGCQKTQQFYL